MKINMNAQLNKETFQNLYYEYKEYLIPIVSITISVFLLFFFLVPQASSLSEKNKEKNIETTKLNELKKSTDLASTTNLKKLDSNLSLASSALPAGKDFERILDDFSTAAINSNVTISDYQFKDVGFSAGSVRKFPALLFQINITATPAKVIDFINKLYNSFPLSEVSNISNSKNNSSVSVVFYYKPFAPVGFEEKTTIRKMNNAQSQALDTISQWENSITGTENASSSSPSAETNSPF